MIIDPTLSWDKQVDSVCLEVVRNITLLKLLSKHADQKSLNLYYNSYILPILDYGCLIWDRCSTVNTNRLIRLQKRAARVVLRADFMTCSKSMFRELQWLPFPLRVEYHSCIMNNQTPQYVSDLFTMASEIHNRNIRSAEQNILRIPYSRTCYFERSFQIHGAKRWNALPL